MIDVCNILVKNFIETITVVNKLKEKNYFTIDVKTIRKFLKIDSSDRSKINFIWRGLRLLEYKGYLKVIKLKPAITYKIPKKKLNLIDVMDNCLSFSVDLVKLEREVSTNLPN